MGGVPAEIAPTEEPRFPMLTSAKMVLVLMLWVIPILGTYSLILLPIVGTAQWASLEVYGYFVMFWVLACLMTAGVLIEARRAMRDRPEGSGSSNVHPR